MKHSFLSTHGMILFWMLGEYQNTWLFWTLYQPSFQGHVSNRLYILSKKSSFNLGLLWEMVKDRGAWHPAVSGVPKSWTWLSYWTKTKCMCIHYNPADPVWVESQEISVKDQKKLCVRKLTTVMFTIVITWRKLNVYQLIFIHSR